MLLLLGPEFTGDSGPTSCLRRVLVLMARIHVVGLPHTLLTDDYSFCAYSKKLMRAPAMFKAGGHKTFLYGPNVADWGVRDSCEEYVPVVFEQDRIDWFGAPEWDKTQVFHRWDAKDVCWTTMNDRTIEAIRARWEEGDVLALVAGEAQKQIVDGLRDLAPQVTEPFIGYSGVLSESIRVFESYTWMHHVAGLKWDNQIRYFDAVIPNCYDLSEFKFSRDKGEYLLFIGRPDPTKGLDIVREITNRCGIPVKVAGQPGHNIPGAEYVGIVSGETKKELFAGAIATMVPTTYLEPFGGVSVESMLSGTPVITTDWGVFTETVRNGVNGFRCRTLKDFLTAVEKVPLLNRGTVRQFAAERFSTEVGAELYGQFFNRVASLQGEGWYEL